MEQLSINITDRQAMPVERMLAQLLITARNDARSIKVILGANVSITIFKLYEPRVCSGQGIRYQISGCRRIFHLFPSGQANRFTLPSFR
jgi:hypothetical protein